MTTSTNTISYTWQVCGLGTTQDLELGLVVTHIYWALTGRQLQQEDLPNCWDHTLGGTLELDSPDRINFTEFQNLAEQQVAGWIESHLGESACATFRTEIERSIASQKTANQTSVEWQPLPWTE